MPIVNKMPSVPTTSRTKFCRFKVYANVRDSNNVVQVQDVYQSDNVERALAHGRMLVDRGNKFVEVRNPSNGWARQLTAGE